MNQPRRLVTALRARNALPALLATAVLFSGCTDNDPVAAGEQAPVASPAAIPGVPTLVLREEKSALSAAWVPILRAVRAVSGNGLEVRTTRTPDETMSTLTFEGGQNDAFLRDVIPGIGKGFHDWLALVDQEAGGTGNFANEPSASTVAFWDVDDQACLTQPGDAPPGEDEEDDGMSDAPCASYREIELERPVSRVSLSYTSYVGVSLTAYDAQGRVVGTANGPANYAMGTNQPGDAGPYNLFSRLHVDAPDEVITRVRINGYIMYTGIDDLGIGRRNLAPVANAGGPYSVNEGSSVTLDASLSADPEDAKEGLSYAWTVGASALSGAQAGATFLDDQPGGYPVTLTVTDQNGKAASATASVVVLNVAPELETVTPVALAGRQLSRSVAFTDPGSDVWTATVDYDVNSGGDAIETLSLSGRSVPLGHTYPASGTYTGRVTVADGDGGVDTKTFQVVVGNSPIELGAIPGATLDEGGSYAATVSFADPDAGPWTVTADFGDGTDPFQSTVTARSFALSHPYRDDGSFEVRTTVSDGQGSASGTATVTVRNVAPTATFSAPASAMQGGALTLALTSPSDPSSADVAAGFTYDFDCGTGYDGFSAAPSVACSGVQPGSLPVRAKIRDKDGGTSEYSALVTVASSNLLPVVTARALSPTVPCIAGYGTAKVAATVSDTDALSYGWYLGSTLRSSSLNAAIVLPLGVHRLEFRATETRSGGGTTTADVTVRVVDNAAPVVDVDVSTRGSSANNGKYLKVDVKMGAVDACTLLASNATAVGYVVSSDPDHAPAPSHGNTTGDIRVVHTHDDDRVELSSNARPRVEFHPGDKLEVRMERAGSKPRIYTISYTAGDDGGTATATETIRMGP